jgi:hypothetical protein
VLYLIRVCSETYALACSCDLFACILFVIVLDIKFVDIALPSAIALLCVEIFVCKLK